MYFTTETKAVTPNSVTKSVTPIKHVIIISQGERSFDNYFGTFPGANGFPKNLTIPLKPFPPPSHQFTVALWFNTNTTFSSKGFLVNKGGLGSDIQGRNMNYGVWMNTHGNIIAGFETKNGTDHLLHSDGKYNDGKWHHVVVTYDGSCTLKLFINGQQNATNDQCGVTPDTKGTQPIRIGSNSLKLKNFFIGFIDEVRIWNRTLEYPEIINGYKNNQFNTDKQFVYLSPKDGKKNALEGSQIPLQLKGIYFNGSSYLDVKPDLPDYMTSLKPFHLEQTKTDRPFHGPKSYKMSYNNGLMNGFLFAQLLNKYDPSFVIGYYDKRQLPYYWDFASEFVLADNFFAPTMNTGLTNEGFLYTGASGVQKNNLSRSMTNLTKSIFDELEESRLSWKVYVEDYDNVLNHTNYLKKNRPINLFALFPRFLENRTYSNVVDVHEYLRDLNTDNFPAVVYIEAPSYDETSPKDVSAGQRFVSALVLALMNSKHWNDSVFIITYRESGGWYDHVQPPIIDGQPYGFRVPTLIISPFSKKGYVDSTMYDATSILKFIEYNYGLSPLTQRDANASNMLNAFDFTKPPRKPLYLEEISRERLILRSDNVRGINTAYFFSLLAPIAVTVIWYYKKRRDSNK